MSTRERILKFVKEAQPYLAVILLQFGYAGSAIIAKSALNHGMSHFTFAVYRNVFATFVFAPFAMVLERKIRPNMTVSIFLKIMLLGLLEPVIDQNLYYTGLRYTTATFATAMCNVLPALTFLLAWILRLEKVNIRRLSSQAKIVGTTVTFGGAMIMALIGGPTIGLPWTRHLLSTTTATSASLTELQPIKGALFIAAGCICWACFYNLQAITLKTYPAALSLTCLICSAGAVEGTALTLVAERGNTSIWAIHLDTKLLSYVYSGMVTSGLGYYVSGLIMKDKGPVFVTAFNPLNMVLVAILGSFILSEQLNLGRVLGGAIIVIGLYLVIWGKSKDQILSKSSSTDDAEAEPVGKETSITKSLNQVKAGDEAV
ncbi:WAT1-related protein At2g39510-like [Nicotiana sylvestris]|uniref:WAT1-related protein n=1 Tax=Nicotiana sylvestris TaxID=4096 RepID=A0A1U7YHI4_NICSY|nr:PREDICTED: WAT1-related protein At2g39510-like [Nicotiana sylvestris]